MSINIEIKNVITAEDYTAIFPNTSAVDRINKAISLSFFIIDGVCSGAITERWDYVGPDETKILTEQQKDYIRKAFLVQTQYIISCNLDIVNQSQSFSVGGLSFSNNKPQIHQLCEAARNYLKKADLFYKTEFVGTSKKGCSFIDDMSPYVTYSVGDKRYLMTHDSTSTHWNKYIFINNQGDVEYKLLGEIFKIYYADILGNIDDNESARNKFALYYTAAICDGKYLIPSDIEQGSNIVLVREGKKIKISATNTGSFLATIDNEISPIPDEPETFDFDTPIKAYLQREGITPVNNDYVIITYPSNDINPKEDMCFYNATDDEWKWAYRFIGSISHLEEAVDRLERGKQDKTDENLPTESKTVVGAITELLNKIPHLYIHRSVYGGTTDTNIIFISINSDPEPYTDMTKLVTHNLAIGHIWSNDDYYTYTDIYTNSDTTKWTIELSYTRGTDGSKNRSWVVPKTTALTDTVEQIF